MTEAVEIVITGPHESIAGIANQLVEERLIACAHLTPIESVYRWRGVVEHDHETRAAMHTTAALAGVVSSRTADLHPYDVPCILVFPVTSGDPTYVAWIGRQVR